MNKKIAYIAGKITGDPDYRYKFFRKEQELQADGYVVLNPSVLPGGMTQAAYMRICLAMIDCADEIHLLPDWKESEGARVEEAYARKIGKPVLVYHLRKGAAGIEALQMQPFRF